MNPSTETRNKTAANLSFDKVDVGGKPRATSCASCKRAITETYFEVNGLVACPPCHRQLMATRSGGSGAQRFLRALLFGGAGAIVGAVTWMIVTHVTGLEIGYVAIAVGLIVGFAVKKGSDARGGFAYQSLAVLLTYLAIVSTYIPDIAKGLDDAGDGRENVTATTSARGHQSAPHAKPIAVHPERDFVDSVVFSVVVFGVALAAPFLMGFENVLGILIIGFALFEAWKINKRVDLKVTGPLRVKLQAGGVRAA